MTFSTWDIAIDQGALSALRARIRDTRLPDYLGEADAWELGAAPAYIAELADYWSETFDWRSQERRINEHLPGHLAQVGDHRVHFARLNANPDAVPILLLHGWPSTFVEFERVANELVRREPCFEVIVPSLPGHGFSSVPQTTGFGADACAEVLHTLMTEALGHDRYLVHGGDRGSFVATSLGAMFPESVAGIHLTLPTGFPATPDPSAEEQTWLSETAAWAATEGGYSAIQGTKPQTLAYAMHDSPVGQLAWIVDKFRAWSDCDGDVEQCFTRDELLTNATIYWLTGTFRAAAHWYWEHRVNPPAATRSDRITVPTGVARFPREVMRTPQSAVARKYDLIHWTDMPAGGHFPAIEQTDLLVDDIITFAGRVATASEP